MIFFHIQVAPTKDEKASSKLNQFLGELWNSHLQLENIVPMIGTVTRLVTKEITVLVIYIHNGNWLHETTNLLEGIEKLFVSH